MSKDHSEAYIYIYTPISRNLWLELGKYDVDNKPQIFNIKRQLSNLEQGNDSLCYLQKKSEEIV